MESSLIIWLCVNEFNFNHFTIIPIFDMALRSQYIRYHDDISIEMTLAGFQMEDHKWLFLYLIRCLKKECVFKYWLNQQNVWQNCVNCEAQLWHWSFLSSFIWTLKLQASLYLHCIYYPPTLSCSWTCLWNVVKFANHYFQLLDSAFNLTFYLLIYEFLTAHNNLRHILTLKYFR